MFKLVFIFCVLFISYQILKRRGADKLIWYFGGVLFFPNQITIVTSPSITFSRVLTYALLASFIIENKNWLGKFLKFPLAKALLILFGALLLIGIADSRLNPFFRIYRPFTYYVENFFVLFLTYYFTREIEDVSKIFRWLFIFFSVYVLYGLYNYVFSSSPYHSFINDVYGGVRYAELFINETVANRSRIMGFSDHSFVYGFYLEMIILIMLFYFLNFRIPKKRKYFYLALSGLLLVNLLLVNSRTPIIALALAMTVYYLLGLTIKTKFQVMIIGVTMTVILFWVMPQSTSIIDQTLATFTKKGADIGGSSYEMRMIQLDLSIDIFKQSPIAGNGMSFISEGLGYSSDVEERTSQRDFFGFESYIYKLLIEQGILGIAANIILFSSLFIYLVGRYPIVTHLGKQLIVLALSCTIGFLAFIIGTGDLGTFLFFMSISGVMLKGIELSRYRAARQFVQTEGTL